ncbi:MAG: PilZ domain-containing protein [Hyphomicrobiaceae bacterium]
MPRATTQPEQRAFGRRESRIHAYVRVPGRSPEHCIVRNFSEGGALIEFDVPFEPPQRFRLSIEAKGVDVMCEVRRREGLSFGVEFVADNEDVGAKLLDVSPAVESDPVPVPPRNMLGAGGIVVVVPARELRRSLLA